MSRARDFADLAGSADAGGLTGRNLIINGAMQVAQRGTSFTQSDDYSLDRWKISSSSETLTVTQQSFPQGQTTVARAEKFLRFIVTSTGNFAGIRQRIEGVEKLSGQTVTVSFYARGGQGGQGVPTTFRTYLNQNFGSGGSSSVNVQGSTNHTLTTSWQLFTATTTLGSTSGKTIGTSPYTELFFQQTTGEACDFDIALVQLEIGEQATPFEHRSYADELARCQRYHYRRDITIYDVAAMGGVNSTNRGAYLLNIPTAMRAKPSCSQGSNIQCWYSAGGAVTAQDNLVVVYMDNDATEFNQVYIMADANATLASVGHPLALTSFHSSGTADSHVSLDAEL